MKTPPFPRAFLAAFIGIAMAGSATIARADIKDYEFQLVDQTVQAGPDKTVTVRRERTRSPLRRVVPRIRQNLHQNKTLDNPERDRRIRPTAQYSVQSPQLNLPDCISEPTAQAPSTSSLLSSTPTV